MSILTHVSTALSTLGHDAPGDRISYNEIHGLLLQALELFKSISKILVGLESVVRNNNYKIFVQNLFKYKLCSSNSYV